MPHAIFNFFYRFRKPLDRTLNRILLAVTALVLVGWIAEYGFYLRQSSERVLTDALWVAYGAFIVGNIIRLVLSFGARWKRFITILIILSALGIQALRYWPGLAWGETGDLTPLGHLLLLDLPLLGLIIYELSESNLQLYQIRLNPSLLFILSFMGLSLIGSALLMLPKATVSGISYLDALFTSTSAVCVTGLIVVDTATEFTLMGKVILLSLIQIGGLGILTFTYFFGFFFQGSASFQSTIYLKNMVSAENIGSTLRIILRIVVITIIVEAIGAAAIFLTVEPNTLPDTLNQLGFSLFHSISAFCNAGFSTFSQGLFEETIRFDYDFQWVVILLIILGGIGFPSLVSIGNLLLHNLESLVRRLRGLPRLHKPRIVNLNAVLAINMSAFLLLVGFGLFLLFEHSGTLAAHDSWFGKATAAFFASVTPRTAGFNTVDVSMLAVPSLIVTIGLMWIGASPNSTGGGIKTTTFAVALLNIISIARGKDRMEFRRRQISRDTVYKAFGIMILSIMLILFATVLLTYTEPGIAPYRLIFEAFSAVGTVGLTLDVTSELSGMGKVIIMLCMFIGRVGALTVITALVRKVTSLRYSYPREELKVG